MLYRLRVQRALLSLTFDWQEFSSLWSVHSALDSKQMTGTLVALRNRGVVESLVVHEGRKCHVYWRLSSLRIALRTLAETQDVDWWHRDQAL
jgi:hypothetical protein